MPKEGVALANAASAMHAAADEEQPAGKRGAAEPGFEVSEASMQEQTGEAEDGMVDEAGFAPSAYFSPELPIRQQLTALTIRDTVHKQPAAPAPAGEPPGQEDAAPEQPADAAAGEAAAERPDKELGGDSDIEDDAFESSLEPVLVQRARLPPKTPQSAARRGRVEEFGLDAPTPIRNPMRVATPARCPVWLFSSLC